ncbi:hypothetical protein JCM19239_4286 [Vibrio variabilis]|uniref:Uncharacterized protein n=1 Tax=Vibrio variabilis TaxID=990271 RepID=A0ABQ0JAJ8_9VIBR|nr:hypothetical protein JCM19239_4286 [Vibrio variabilis]
MKKTNLAIGIGLSMALLSVLTVVKSQEGKGDLVEVTRFPSRYMDANQPMFELEMGARVAKDTYDYWNLPTDSPSARPMTTVSSSTLLTEYGPTAAVHW